MSYILNRSKCEDAPGDGCIFAIEQKNLMCYNQMVIGLSGEYHKMVDN